MRLRGFPTDGVPALSYVGTPTGSMIGTATPPIGKIISVPGQPGPQGEPGGAIRRATAQILSGHRLVTANDSGAVIYADAANPAHMSRPIWLTTSAWSAGADATLITAGVVTEPSWSWTPGLPIWLGVSGAMTQAIPSGAAFVRRVAAVIDATTIEFNTGEAIAVIG